MLINKICLFKLFCISKVAFKDFFSSFTTVGSDFSSEKLIICVLRNEIYFIIFKFYKEKN